MSELTCPHCGKAIRLTPEGQLVKVAPVEEPPRRTRGGSWGTPASSAGMDAFAGAFKRKAVDPSPPRPVTRAPEPSPPPPVAAPRPADLVASRPSPAPAPGPAITEPAPRPRPAAGGVNVLDALARDASLNQGQRETLRLIYVRFAPQVTAGPGTEPLDLGQVIEQDANLNEGQKETLRLVYRRFKRPR